MPDPPNPSFITLASEAQTSAPNTSQTRNLDVPISQQRADLRIPDTALPYFRIARRALQAQLRSEHHAEYLKFCLDNNSTPRGLQTRVQPSIPEQSFQFTIKWETAHTEVARNLTILLQKYYLDHSAHLKNEVDSAGLEIRKLCSPIIHKHFEELLSKIKKDLLIERKERRTNKARRDVEGSRSESQIQPSSSST